MVNQTYLFFPATPFTVLKMFSKCLSVFALIVFGGGCDKLVAADLVTKHPNVIIILADDLGYGELGCFGHRTFKTPHLDRMAAEGARLTHFNAPAPFCAPSRASLMTGRYPFAAA